MAAHIAADIANYLRAELGTTNVYVGSIPEPDIVGDTAAGVREMPGGISEYVMGSTVASRVAYTVTIVQVNVRGPKDGWEEAATLMGQVHDLLRFAAGVQVGDHVYDKIMAETEPFTVTAPDTGERPMLACIYECWLRGAG